MSSFEERLVAEFRGFFDTHGHGPNELEEQVLFNNAAGTQFESASDKIQILLKKLFS